METLALVGNPNSGKTTLFNALTGANQKTGNYPGVTVEKKEGYLEVNGTEHHIVDLPGTYSLTAYSEDENPEHRYSELGFYDVNLLVQNEITYYCYR